MRLRIKPARGWTWVNAGILFPPVAHGTPSTTRCVRSVWWIRTPRRGSTEAGLIWVGESFYKTPREFMNEAIEMGISRRITAVPRGFVIGESWVLLGHRKVVSKGYKLAADKSEEPTIYETLMDAARAQAEEGQGEVEEVWAPGIFTAFRPTKIEYIVKEDDSEEKLEALVERGIELVRVVQVKDEVELPLDGEEH